MSTARAKPALVPARSVRAGDLLFIGAQTSVAIDGQIQHPGDVRAQARVVFESIGALLTEHGGILEDVLSVTSFHADARLIQDVLEIGTEFFADSPPAWTQAGFVGCQHPGALVAVRAIAHLGAGAKRSFLPDSQRWRRRYPMAAATQKGGLLFIAGQVAGDRNGRVTLPVDHCDQAREAYAHLRQLLAEAGATLDDVLDFTSFHLDIRGAIPTLEEVYIPEVIGSLPSDRAATTSHVGSTGLLRPDLLGTYTAIADTSGGGRIGSTPEIITWNDNGNYPIAGGAKKEGGTLITIAGQVSSGPDGRVLHPGDSDAQLRFIMEEIAETLAGLDATMADVTEVCSFHKDPRSWDATMRIAAEFFDAGSPPTWSFVGSPGLWLEGYQHEIAALAVLR